MATPAVTCLQTTGQTYTHVFLCGGCRCLSSGSMQVVFAAIGALALLFAFNLPMSESTHVALIIGASLSIVLTLIGLIYCKIPKRIEKEPAVGLEQDITITTPPLGTPFFDMTGTIASADPDRSSRLDIATLTPSVARVLDFGSPQRDVNPDGSVEIKVTDLDLTSADAPTGWQSLDAGVAFTADP